MILLHQTFSHITFTRHQRFWICVLAQLAELFILSYDKMLYVCLSVWMLIAVAQIVSAICNLVCTNLLINSYHKPNSRTQVGLTYFAGRSYSPLKK